MEEMGCHMLEGLQQRCRCMGPVSEGATTPPAGRSTLGHVGGPRGRSRPKWSLVGERRHGAGRGGRLSMLLAAELQALSLGHAATDVRGHGCGQDGAWAAVWRARGRARGSGD